MMHLTMLDSRLLTGILILALGWLFQKKWRLYRKMAPGPYGIPVVGSMLHLLKANVFIEFQKYREKYGKVFSLSVGNYYVTVVTDYRLILNSLKRDEFGGRPGFELWAMRNGGNQNRGVAFSEKEVWHEQRRFALRTLRDYGFGKNMDGMLTQELQDLQRVLKEDLGQPISLTGVFNASVLNSLWFIMTGSRFELDDPGLKSLISLFTQNVKATTITTPGLFFFTPVKYGLMNRQSFQSLQIFLRKITHMFEGVIKEHLEGSGEGESRHFVDSFIRQVKECRDSRSSFYSDEGMKNLYVILTDLFNAGAETTSTTLQWAILYLCHYPKVQLRVQEEIDNVIGKNRPPSRDDKTCLVYLEAVLNEVHRKAALIPFNVYHKVLEDSEIGGYFIPKDSVIFFSIRDAHHDKDVWGDPENFRPQRFLDATGTKVVKHEALIPFSAGKRQCLGESLARDTLFMFLTGLLQRFSFKLDPDSAASKSGLEGRPGFVSTPEPFKVIITERT